jgi:hypothetical protein
LKKKYQKKGLNGKYEKKKNLKNGKNNEWKNEKLKFSKGLWKIQWKLFWKDS